MNPVLFVIVLTVSVFLTSVAGTWLVLLLLRKYRVIDVPNSRSNHKVPVPRGGGIALVATILGGIFLFCHPLLPLMPLYLGMLMLALVSFYDDMKGLSIILRFACQIIAVAVGVWSFPDSALIFQGFLPPFLDKLIMGLAWLWFVNLYNFMDGIDGITGTETAFIGIGVALIAASAGLPITISYTGLIVAASALGFLVWNWHPAKLFMGDVGSVPLGFITGWLLLFLATKGLWAAALIIPAYYLADSTITLLRRMIEGKKFWQSHSEHFYQQAVRSGKRHNKVVQSIVVTNTLLLVLAFTSTLGVLWMVTSLVIAGLTVAGLIRFWRISSQKPHAQS